MSSENLAAIEAKKRRRRTTPEELQLLEEEYLRDPLPSSSKRAEIAHSVGMSTRNVQVWYQNKRQNEKRRQHYANENEPLTFVETSFARGDKMKRTTSYFQSKTRLKDIQRSSPKITTPKQSSQPPLSRSPNHVHQKVPPSPIETLPNDIKPRGKNAMSLSSLLCSPPKSTNRALWDRIAEEDRENDGAGDGRARGALISRRMI